MGSAPYAGIASFGSRLRQVGVASESDVIMMYENLNKALELDPNSVESLSVKAGITGWTEFDWKKAENGYLRAIELNPSHVRSHIFYAHMLSILRRTDEALYHGKKSGELDPENPFTLAIYVYVLFENGKCQEALYYAEKGLSIAPVHPILLDPLWRIYECLGDNDKAIETWKRRGYPLWEEYVAKEFFEKVFQEHGRIAFIEEFIRADDEVWKEDGRTYGWSLAERYVRVGKYDKAMDIYDKMKGNPRYLALLEKLKLRVSDDQRCIV